ncbi:hypothetical protein BJY52DRAFT_926910 [Lactarius psammicola]|nr:hypothetical protein BJY52DRAFT_926910 [Lactarius psammicola]
MYSPKTLTQALLVASVATSSLAAHIPNRGGVHEARAGLVLPAGLASGLSKGAANIIKAVGIKGLVNGGIKTTITDVQNRIKNNNNSTARGFDTQDLDARALPNISPEIVDLVKTSAVGGLVGGATGATINGLINLFKDKNDTQQARGLDTLSDDDLRLLSVLSRRVIEELD